MKLADAQKTLAEQHLKSAVNQVFSTTVAKGKVISTDPAAGDGVKPDGTVTLTVSKGPQIVQVPDVAKLSVDEATARLKAAGLTVSVDQGEAYSGKVKEGLVIGTSPKVGSNVTVGREVRLTVSKGPEPVTVPNVVGAQIDAAKAQLNSLGLKVDTVTVPNDNNQTPGTVTAQNKDPGALVDKGSTVILSVVAVPDGQTKVPNVVGRKLRDARKALASAGFQVQVANGWFGGNPKDSATVTGQNPGGDSYAPTGSTVVLMVDNG
jgi:serine/threonine-protein kinase